MDSEAWKSFTQTKTWESKLERGTEARTTGAEHTVGAKILQRKHVCPAQPVCRGRVKGKISMVRGRKEGIPSQSFVAALSSSP